MLVLLTTFMIIHITHVKPALTMELVAHYK